MNKILTSLIAALALNAGAADYITKYNSTTNGATVIFPPNAYAAIRLTAISAQGDTTTSNGTVTVYLPTGTTYTLATNVLAGDTNVQLVSTAGLVAGDALISVDTATTSWPNQTCYGFTVSATNATLGVLPKVAGALWQGEKMPGKIETTATLYQAKPYLVRRITTTAGAGAYAAPQYWDAVGDAVAACYAKGLPVMIQNAGATTQSKVTATARYDILPR